jgi:hypothetical protein
MKRTKNQPDELMTVTGAEIERHPNASSVIVSVHTPRGESEWCVHLNRKGHLMGAVRLGNEYAYRNPAEIPGQIAAAAAEAWRA